MPNLLLGVRTKIDRAKKHLRDLESEVRAYKARAPFVVIKEVEPQTQDEIYRVRIREHIPLMFGAIVGDCIHNFRSALDLLANELVTAGGGTPTDNTKFPISSQAGFMDNDIRASLMGASNAAIAIVKSLKPHQGADNPFWRLHKLDIADKHKLLVPVALSHRAVRMIFDPVAMFAEAAKEMPNLGGLRPFSIDINAADRQFPLKDGAIVFRVAAAVAAAKHHAEPQFIFDIAFGEGQIVDGEPLAPTLQQLGDFTERTVNIIAKSIF